MSLRTRESGLARAHYLQHCCRPLFPLEIRTHRDQGDYDGTAEATRDSKGSRRLGDADSYHCKQPRHHPECLERLAIVMLTIATMLSTVTPTRQISHSLDLAA